MKESDSKNALSLLLDLCLTKYTDFCQNCKEKKLLILNFLMEIFNIDILAEKESINMIETFLKNKKKDWQGYEENLPSLSKMFRTILKNCFTILPNHALFFEKLFKIM